VEDVKGVCHEISLDVLFLKEKESREEFFCITMKYIDGIPDVIYDLYGKYYR